MQYRFGRPDKIEFEYPSQGKFTPSSFDFFHYFRPNEDQTSLHFQTNDVDYTVFSDSNGSKTSAGVTVKIKTTNKVQSIRCTGKIEAKWSAIEDKVECTDDPMNTCQ